jgi:transketolase
VGEDGPTHQPVEQVAALRAMPGLLVIRPADATETAGAWRVAINRAGPVALILSRQGLPVLESTSAEAVALGGYVVAESNHAAITLVGTGSEVSVCLDAAALLASEGVAARVVSLPCWELFESSPPAERDAVLRPDVPSLGVEAGVSMGWHRWVDDVVAIDRFGASAPGDTVLSKLGISPENVADRARAILEGQP